MKKKTSERRRLPLDPPHHLPPQLRSLLHLHGWPPRDAGEPWGARRGGAAEERWWWRWRRWWRQEDGVRGGEERERDISRCCLLIHFLPFFLNEIVVASPQIQRDRSPNHRGEREGGRERERREGDRRERRKGGRRSRRRTSAKSRSFFFFYQTRRIFLNVLSFSASSIAALLLPHPTDRELDRTPPSHDDGLRPALDDRRGPVVPRSAPGEAPLFQRILDGQRRQRKCVIALALARCCCRP